MTKTQEGPQIDFIRYERLRLVIEKALEQTTAKSLSLDQIAKCFPKIAESKDGLNSLNLARKQMKTHLDSVSSKEFALIFSEHDIEKKLNELDEVIQMAQYRKEHNQQPVEVDKLSPFDIIESSLLPSKESVMESLSMIYNQLLLDNRELYQSLKSKAEESEEIKREIDNSIESLTRGIDELKEDRLNENLNNLIQEVLEE